MAYRNTMPQVLRSRRAVSYRPIDARGQSRPDGRDGARSTRRQHGEEVDVIVDVAEATIKTHMFMRARTWPSWSRRSG
jgi:hypothetical protein